MTPEQHAEAIASMCRCRRLGPAVLEAMRAAVISQYGARQRRTRAVWVSVLCAAWFALGLLIGIFLAH